MMERNGLLRSSLFTWSPGYYQNQKNQKNHQMAPTHHPIGVEVDIVSTEASGNGRSCFYHKVCGSIVAVDTVVRFLNIQILNCKSSWICSNIAMTGLTNCFLISPQDNKMKRLPLQFMLWRMEWINAVLASCHSILSLIQIDLMGSWPKSSISFVI